MEHKARSLLSAAGIFIALLIPLRFPEFFWYIITIVSCASALLVFWVFDEKPGLQRIKEDWFTIIFLLFFVFSSGIFGYLMPHPAIQALILGSTGVCMYFLYLAASRMKRNYTPSLLLRNISSMAVLLGIFYATSDITRWVSVYNSRFAELFSMVLVFLSVFVMSEFLFEVQGVEKSILYSLAASFAITQIVWLLSYWLITYPQSERITQVGVPLPAVVASIYFYSFWGLSHHNLEGSLTKKILWEYVIISLTFTAIIFITAKWMPNY